MGPLADAVFGSAVRAGSQTPADAAPEALTTVTITSTSHTPAVAFFLRADVRRGDAEGTPAPGDDELLPTLWSDNDTTLWPGETETLTASYSAAGLDGEQPVITVSGWNVAPIDVPAPGGL